MDIVLSIFRLITGQVALIVSISLLIIWGCVVITFFIKGWSGESSEILFSLAMAGWIIPVLGLAFLSYLFISIAPTVVILSTLFIFWKQKIVLDSKMLLIGLAIGILFFIRMAFVSRTILPAYFDSAEHYQLIKILMKNDGVNPFQWPEPGYYHIGYHLIAAMISTFTPSSIAQTMLTSGQIILAILPVSLFFIVGKESGSHIAAWFTVLLAGLGWDMPAYAVNWGKYPALFSLVGIHFLFGLVYLLFRKQKPNANKNWIILLISALAVGLIHSRSLIIFGILLISFFTSIQWEKLISPYRQIVLGSLICLLAYGLYHSKADPMFAPLFTTYFTNDLLITGLILFLAPFAYQKSPNLTFALLIFITLMVYCMFVPLNNFLPGYAVLNLLDRPYVQMLMYIPVSILGGLGLAGLSSFVKEGSSAFINTAAFGVVLANAIFYQSYLPSDCCQLVGTDDIAALNWMDESIPADAQVLAASAEVWLISSERPPASAGSDAGVWVKPLTGRDIILFSNQMDLSQFETFSSICAAGADYIYAGGTGFDEIALAKRPEWYRGVFLSPQTKIYEVIGCSQ